VSNFKRCPVCNKTGVLVTGSIVYPHIPKIKDRYFYQCKEHDALVGCHPDTKIPLGKLALPALRQLRLAVHRLFDPLWIDGDMSRSEAYRFFGKLMNLSKQKCHVAKFDEDTCQKAIMLLNSYWEEIKAAEHAKKQADKWKPREPLIFK
jgi:hypothetical protein